MNARILPALTLMALSGVALGQIAVDGKIGTGESALYGPPLWVQNVPTGFGDNAIAGGSCNQSDVGTPGAVTTGMEIKIPLSAIGNPTGAVRICAFINGGGHDSVSNQVLGGLPAQFDGLGEPRTVDFSTIPGNQYFTVTADAGAVPTVDGTLDAAYGAAKALQTNRTSFVDNGDTSGSSANGSELDGAYAVIRGGVLYIMLTGNQASDFTKLELFIDTDANTGYGQLGLGTFPDVDFSALQRMQADASNPGLKFDSGFTADYYMTWGCGGTPVSQYPNFANLLTGAGMYLGSCATGSGNGILAGGTNPDNIEVAINNSNIGGVPARCPPTSGNRDTATGSEIDNLRAYIDTDANRLHIFMGGNLQNVYNKIDLFFDVDPNEGQHTLRGDNPEIDFGALQNMGSNGVDPGLTFDAGFTADYWIGFTTGGNIQVFANAAVLRANGKMRDFSGNSLDYGAYDGGNKAQNDPIDFAGPNIDPQDGFHANIYTNYSPRKATASLLMNPSAPVGTPNQIYASLDNSNVAGVTGAAADYGAAYAVNTGLEFSIDLDELGWDHHSCIKIAGMLQNGGHDYMSNQVIGGLPNGSPNLGTVGNTRQINFSTIAGDQFVSVCAGSQCHGQCTADFDDGSGTGVPDGGVTIDDLLYYLGLFSQGAVCADVDDGSGTGTQDGGVTIDDLLYFLQRFAIGC